MVKHYEIDPSEGTAAIDCPERALWLAVIEQQICDATFGFSRKIDGSSDIWISYRRPTIEHIRNSEDALRWFFTVNDTFIPICMLAQVDYENLRDRVKLLMKKLEEKLGEIPSRQNIKKKKNDKK